MRPYYPLSENWALTQLSTGQPFFVDTRSRDVTPWIVMGGIWETFVDDVLCALARPGDTFVDAGSNMGYYTVKVGGLVGPTGRVFAFEANPEIFPFVRENININGLSARDTAVNAALGAELGSMTFCHDPSHPGGGIVLMPHEGVIAGQEVRTVPVVSLDSALPADARLDLMKIDVEGFEVPVLRGMQKLLARSPDAAIVCEVAADMWARFGDPSELLRTFAAGRTLYRIFPDGRLQEMSGDRIDGWLESSFVSYVLMLPDTPARQAQIAPLLARFAPKPAAVIVEREEAEAEADVDPAPVVYERLPDPVAAPSLLERIARRLR